MEAEDHLTTEEIVVTNAEQLQEMPTPISPAEIKIEDGETDYKLP